MSPRNGHGPAVRSSISLRDVKKNLEGIGEDEPKQAEKGDKKRTASEDKRKPGPKRPT